MFNLYNLTGRVHSQFIYSSFFPRKTVKNKNQVVEGGKGYFF